MMTTVVYLKLHDSLKPFRQSFGSYWDICLASAKRWGPVVLIGDTPTTLVEWADERELGTPLVAEFKRRYVHKSANDPEFECSCFLRFFYLQRWMELHEATQVIHLDSDVMLFDNPQKYFPEKGIGLTSDDRQSYAANSAMLTKEAVDLFVDMALTQDLPASDMGLFDRISGQLPVTVLSRLSGIRFDHGFHCYSGYQAEKLDSGQIVKKVRWNADKGMPEGALTDGTPVLFASLHFQNGFKHDMTRWAAW